MGNLGLGMEMECLSKLTKKQRIAFIQTFLYLAHADGKLSKTEKDFIINLAEAYGLSEKDRDEVLSVKDEATILKNAKSIKDKRAAMELIKELCVLAYADEGLTDKELLFIGKIGKATGVKPEKIEQISKWVIDRIIWLEEGKLIFGYA